MRAAAAAAAEAPTVELPRVEPIDSARRGRRVLVATAAVLALSAGALAFGVLAARSAGDSAQIALLDDTALAPATEPGDDAETVERTQRSTQPGVDNIAISGELGAETALAGQLHDELAASMPRVQAATDHGMREGSGFFVTSDGYLVTSAQLVSDSEYLLVWTHDGGRWHADLVAADGFSDVAVLKVVDAPAFPAAFKNTDELWAGQYAMAIDHDQSSMTVGEVASLTSAAPAVGPGDRSSRFRIEPGMKPGAAIVDDTGSVIGLVNADAATQATPGWMVERVTADLIAAGVTVHPWLGVHVEPDPTSQHVKLTTIVGGSPADLAGLRAGDLIDAVDGTELSTTQSFWTLLQRQRPGDRVDLAVTRNGERRLISVELTELVD